MSRSESIRLAKETIAARRARNVELWERRIAEVSAKVPEFREIDRALASTGAKIFAASLNRENREAELEAVRGEYEALGARRRRVLSENGYPEDYCDIRYTCPLCSDSGYVGIEMCECLRKEIVARFLESSGLYALTETQTFETFSLDYYERDSRKLMEQNVGILKRYAEEFEVGVSPSYLFLGATGLGKTHLSSAVARAVIERGHYVVYESAQGMFGEYEQKRFGNSSFGGSDDAVDTERFEDCDLLIIDDLGAEITNQFTVSCLYHLLNTRMIRKKPTVISTNLSHEELRKRYSERIASRIFGEFHPLLFSGTDVRMQKIRRG